LIGGCATCGYFFFEVTVFIIIVCGCTITDELVTEVVAGTLVNNATGGVCLAGSVTIFIINVVFNNRAVFGYGI